MNPFFLPSESIDGFARFGPVRATLNAVSICPVTSPLLFTRLAGIILLLSWTGALQVAGQPAEPGTNSPQMLDLHRYIRERFITAESTNITFQSLIGIQKFDGLPFRIEGRGWVYGSKEAQWHNAPVDSYPDLLSIQVGRTFDELHLLHASRWQEVDGRDIARIRAHYADGTTNDWVIVYGAHVRDWQRLHSEETESLSDPCSKIVWRGTPRTVAMSSAVRLFKTVFTNSFPEKVVTTLDVISSRRMAAYDLVAATVATREPSRPLTKPAVVDGPRKFRKSVTIRVVDAATAQPLLGVLIDPAMVVDGAGIIATPQLTGTNGEAVIRYPGMQATSLFVAVSQSGYYPAQLAWGSKKFGPALWQRALEYVSLMGGYVPTSATISLVPSNAPPVLSPDNR